MKTDGRPYPDSGYKEDSAQQILSPDWVLIFIFCHPTRINMSYKEDANVCCREQNVFKIKKTLYFLSRSLLPTPRKALFTMHHYFA